MPKMDEERRDHLEFGSGTARLGHGTQWHPILSHLDQSLRMKQGKNDSFDSLLGQSAFFPHPYGHQFATGNWHTNFADIVFIHS